MANELRISIVSCVPLEDIVARVVTERGDEYLVVLTAGRFVGVVERRPVRLFITTLYPGAGMFRTRSDVSTSPSASSSGPSLTVNVVDLLEQGVVVPADGRLDLEILWLAPCEMATIPTGEGSRFGSFEHTRCAALVGMDVDGRSELTINGMKARFSRATLLPVGDKKLTFGEIIALAGDFYAHLDQRSRETFTWAWPAPPSGLTGWLMGDDYRTTTLVDDEQANVDEIREKILSEGSSAKLFDAVSHFVRQVQRHPTRRYLALASQNICHFANQLDDYGDAGNVALELYRAYHGRAIREATEAGAEENRDAFLTALVTDAFACHFLTDLFASGHIRVPRRILGERFGIVRGALLMSKKMHDEDNAVGLWCSARVEAAMDRRVVWRAFGDGSLEALEAKDHLDRVIEAVRVSSAEVFEAFATKGRSSPGARRAEDLVPVPLAPGRMPSAWDTLPNGCAAPQVLPNHFPLYTIRADGRVAERVGPRDRDEYVDLEPSAPQLVTV